MSALPCHLPDLLQQARKTRRWSQLELAARVGVSQRHVSFVERGRARPSRALLMRWLQELGAPPAPSASVMTTRFATPHGELAFFSMFTTFGTPQDITLASLRVEHMFAADSATLAVIRTQVG